MWLVLFIIYENFRFNRLFERHRRRLENARAEFPSLMVSINQILTDYDPIEMVGQPDFEDVYEGEAADIIYRLHANIEPTDIRAYLKGGVFQSNEKPGPRIGCPKYLGDVAIAFGSGCLADCLLYGYSKNWLKH